MCLIKRAIVGVGKTIERGGEAAPTLHLIKVLKERDQKQEKKKSNQINFLFICGENAFFVSQSR